RLVQGIADRLVRQGAPVKVDVATHTAWVVPDAARGKMDIAVRHCLGEWCPVRAQVVLKWPHDQEVHGATRFETRGHQVGRKPQVYELIPGGSRAEADQRTRMLLAYLLGQSHDFIGFVVLDVVE